MLRRAVIAAVVGAACGAAAAYRSAPIDGPDQSSVAVTARPSAGGAAGPAVRPPPSPPDVPLPPPQNRAAGAVTQAPDDRPAAVRARLLAQRPDVTGLVALREQMVRRAEDAGENDSPATKAQLDEIDRYLAEARLLRLKLDAAEFRTKPTDGTPPR